MSSPKPLVLGEDASVSGDVTQNRWVGARSARELEASVGYQPGRLAAGWWVLLLKQPLAPTDFEFSGLTIRSGGRIGLPAATPEDDKSRPRVHDQFLAQAGQAEYVRQQARVAASIPGKGADRIVKVIPVTRHSTTLSPQVQYPMGGGGLQWTLIKECRFLVAMFVDGHGIAHTPGFTANLGASVPYEERARVAQYLNEA